MSSLSSELRRSSMLLREGASTHVLDYERRFSSLEGIHDLLSDLVRMNSNTQATYAAASDFFGEDRVRFAGIDGTMYSHPLFDMIAFFGGAYASTGTIAFKKDAGPQVEYDRKTLKQSLGISSVVPVYINEVPDIDQSLTREKQPLTDGAIVSNATIANWLMTFAEYYLAYKLASDPTEKTRVILLDRSLSVERASLLYDTADRENWKAEANVIGCAVNGEVIDVNDLTLARQSVCCADSLLPPPRADYLRYAILPLVRDEALGEDQIMDKLDLTDEKRRKRARRYIKRWVEENVLLKKDAGLVLNPKYVDSWNRVKKLVSVVGDRLFYSREPLAENVDVMKIVKNGRRCWLTTVDFAFLTLFALQMLMEECWKRRVLLIGITKDTAARDFKRQLVPIMLNEGLLKSSISRETFENLPNTDRMILQSASLFNPDQIRPPWCLVEYDSAFRTMIPDRSGKKGHVSGAIKNKIGLERTLVKTYVQLSQAKTDSRLRSNVLLIDRLVYPEFDCKEDSVVEFKNELSDGSTEPVRIVLFKNKNIANKVQDLAMSILIAMAPSNIPEAFGHNKPLFIADKIAKWNYGQFKRIVDTTAVWILNNHKLRRFIFYMSTFRERRASIEAARRE